METGALKTKPEKDKLIQSLVFEFLGSIIITLAFYLRGGPNGALTDPRSWGYFVSWLFAGNISGAHFNPAITLVVWVYEKCKKEYIKYLICACIVQICGSYTGILISYLILKPELNPKNSLPLLYPDS